MKKEQLLKIVDMSDPLGHFVLFCKLQKGGKTYAKRSQREAGTKLLPTRIKTLPLLIRYNSFDMVPAINRIKVIGKNILYTKALKFCYSILDNRIIISR